VPALQFQLDADAGACRWLESHPSTQVRVIAYDVHRWFGGGKLCLVKVRDLSHKDDPEEFTTGYLANGTRFLIDRKAAVRLPSQFRLTVRGI
jgi:hypothetical protein